MREWREKFARGVDNGLSELAQLVIDEAKPIIAEEATDKGDVLESGEVVRVSAGHYQARWSAAHAIYVNYGTRPHWPPIQAIIDWVQRNVRAKGRKNTPARHLVVKPSSKRGTATPTVEETLAIAYAIQAKIAKKGTEPVLFAERAYQRASKHSQEIMTRNVREALGA